jgi:hypothetical protein
MRAERDMGIFYHNGTGSSGFTLRYRIEFSTRGARTAMLGE